MFYILQSHIFKSAMVEVHENYIEGYERVPAVKKTKNILSYLNIIISLFLSVGYCICQKHHGLKDVVVAAVVFDVVLVAVVVLMFVVVVVVM